MLANQTAGMDVTDSALAPSSGGGGGGLPAGSYTAIGSMFGPWGTAVGAAADLFMGGSSGASGGGVVPSSASQSNPTAFDNSGWTVNIGSGSATATASKSAGLGLPSWAIPAIAIFGILAWAKKK